MAIPSHLLHSSNPFLHSSRSQGLHKLAGRGGRMICALPGATAEAAGAVVEEKSGKTTHKELLIKRPDEAGKFGRYGGRYVPEVMVQALCDLEAEYRSIARDKDFQEKLNGLLRDYAGRPTPLYFAKRLSDCYKRHNGEGPDIYLKREDLNHTRTYKINNAIAQTLLAHRLGKTCIVTETGASHHGVAVAAASARLGMRCIVYIGARDVERKTLNVSQMDLLGAEVRVVHSGTASLKDAAADAVREWISNMDSSYYLFNSVVGPHPCPAMVRDFQAVIGRETRRQAAERWGQGRKPDVLVACVGGGSNAMGLFHEFVDDDDVRLVGVEGAGHGLGSGSHSATLGRGDVGVMNGAMSYLLQDGDGQILDPHSIAAGLRYPGVGPEHSFLKDIGRVEYHSVTDQEAVEAFHRLSRLEGIVPALETSHALAYLDVLCPTLPSGAKVVVNCSGGGDADESIEAYSSQK